MYVQSPLLITLGGGPGSVKLVGMRNWRPGDGRLATQLRGALRRGAAGHQRPDLVSGHRQRGRLVTMVPGAALAVLIAMGVGVDFTGQVQTEQYLRDVAGQCARQATTQIGLDRQANRVAALAAAQACLSRLGVTGQASLVDGGVTVTVEGTYSTKLLGIIGVATLPATASAGAVVQTER